MTDEDDELAAGDNPAQRLVAIFETAERYRGDTHAPASQAWMTIFGIPQSPTENVERELLRLAARTVGLAAETRTKIELLDPLVNSSLILEHFDQVETTLANFLGFNVLPMSAFLSPLQPTGMYCLRHAADALHRHAPERVISKKTAQDLLAQTRDLIDDVAEAADLDEETKRRLVGLLRDVETALVDIRITGTGRIDEAGERLVGGLLRLDPGSWASKTLQRVGRFAQDLVVTTVAATVAATVPALVVDKPDPPTPPPVIVIDYLIQRHDLPALSPPPASDGGPAAISPPGD